MKSNFKFCVVLAFSLFYIIAGGWMFQFFEVPKANELQEGAREYYREFLETHRCLSHSDFMDLIEKAQREWRDDVNWSEINATEPNTRKWTWTNSVLFAVTVLTTIGYGHLAPRSVMSRILVVVYAILGIPLTALLIEMIGVRVQAILSKLQRRLQTSLLSFIPSRKFRQIVSAFIICVVCYTAFVVGPAVFFMFFEGWSYEEAQYFTFVTLSTIGFGDYVAGNSEYVVDSPWKTAAYRYSVIAYLFLGLGTVAILMRHVRQFEERNTERASSFSKRLIRPIGERSLKKRHSQPSLDLHDVVKASWSPNGVVITETREYIGDQVQTSGDYAPSDTTSGSDTTIGSDTPIRSETPISVYSPGQTVHLGDEVYSTRL